MSIAEDIRTKSDRSPKNLAFESKAWVQSMAIGSRLSPKRWGIALTCVHIERQTPPCWNCLATHLVLPTKATMEGHKKIVLALYVWIPSRIQFVLESLWISKHVCGSQAVTEEPERTVVVLKNLGMSCRNRWRAMYILLVFDELPPRLRCVWRLVRF